METPKQIKEAEADEARLRQATPAHFPHGLVLREPPELGWERETPACDIAPNVRHINRVRHGVQWLGPAIEKPPHLRPDAA
jgi:hypothetical protein